MRPATSQLVTGFALVAACIACGTSASRADNAKLCSDVAGDLAGSGLAGTPDQEQAAAAGSNLDSRVRQVADPGLHDQVVKLHSHLHALDAALRKGNSAAADRAAGQARQDATAIAERCQMPVERFVGG